MALGLKSAGLGPSLLYEYDLHAYKTLENNGLVEQPVPDWERHQGNVRNVDWMRITVPVGLLAGGVPCQPFSLGGKHLADRDGRNMFPEFFRAAYYLRPAAMFVENVSGLMRDSFRPYLHYILRRMEYPSLLPLNNEMWEDHDTRLRQHQSSASYQPEYHVAHQPVDAADYGVPQNRKRVFIVATRADLPIYHFPKPTHSRAALIASQSTGEYWDRHGIAHPQQTLPFPKMRGEASLEPWLTVRDALASLPEPSIDEDTADIQHWLIPGARAYKGHTGSRLDWPSKTLKAGVNGVPGGENTLIDDSGEIRYFTIREAARVQTFPDEHFFFGTRKHVTRQIGNAVPCILAEVLARPLVGIIPTYQLRNEMEASNV